MDLRFIGSHSYADDSGITLPIKLRLRDTVVELAAHIDTGASACLFEARYEEVLGLDAIVVEDNTFLGGMAAIAFVNADGAVVRRNRIEQPSRWVVRILQENRSAGFFPCRKGSFVDNIAFP